MKQKNKISSESKGLKRQTRSVQQLEIRGILEQTERPVNNRLTDAALDREREISNILNRSETTWIELYEAHLKFQSFINAKLREWELTFPEELYRQWRRLLGWDMNSKTRPQIFAQFTVRDVYGSLPREIYGALEGINEYIYPGIRMYRYCQLVTTECHDKVREIIQTLINIAKSSSDLYEYRLKLASVYGAPFSKTVFQIDLFRDNQQILGQK